MPSVLAKGFIDRHLPRETQPKPPEVRSAKFAARKTDQTEHGGVVMEGSHNVTVNGLPAARFNDFHECATDTEGYQHVGGPITEGYATVTINGRMAARKGDHLLCIGPGGGSEGGDSTENEGDEPNDEISLKHEREKETTDRKWGSPEIDGRRGQKKYQKDPLLNFEAKHDWAKGEGNLAEFWGGHGKLGDAEWHAKSQVDAEIRGITDFRINADAIDVGGSVSVANLDTGEVSTPIGTGSAELDVLHAEAIAKAGLHVDTKKKEVFGGLEAELGGAVVEGKITGETAEIPIWGTNWAFKIQAEGSGSLVSAKAEGHAGFRGSKKGLSARVGAKLALGGGLGFDLGISIAPREPPKIPQDMITTGSHNVIIGH